MRRIGVAVAALLTSVTAAWAQTPHILRHPAISSTEVAFVYADDIWTVPLAGGEARRLTSTSNVTDGPFFSPDGRTLAYSARVGHSEDVFTVPVNGGAEHRITYRPDGSDIVGWTPDGKDLIVAGPQESVRMYLQLYKVHADGHGLPEKIPVPSGIDASYSPDGSHMAYNPILQWQAASFKRYRGGQTQRVWIIDTKTLELTKVPRENSNDTNPVWLGNSVYFLSDRNGPFTLFRYDTATRQVKQVVENAHGFDLKNFTGEGHTIAYEQFGTIHILNTDTGENHVLNPALDGDLPALEPHIARIPPQEIGSADISPTGVRAVFAAHGDIFTVPAEKGDIRNLTDTSNAAEREPAWSADGNRVAYFSDASGEYQLYLRDQSGNKPPQVIDLGPSPTYYYDARWSPDSKHILFSDKRLNLWYVNVDPALGPAKPVKVAKSQLSSFGHGQWHASFSPDSKWILYAQPLPSFEHAAFLYEIKTAKSTQITDGMSDVTSPVWDAGGKYIFFGASTDVGPSIDGFGLGSLNRTATSSVYVAVLSKDEPSPIPPESDEEKAKTDDNKPSPADSANSDEKKDPATGKAEDQAKKTADKKADAAQKAAAKDVKIDLDGIQQRILALPIPARNYIDIQPGKTGVLLLAEGPPANNPADEAQSIRSVWRFKLETRKTEDVLHNTQALAVSANGEKVLYRKGPAFFIAAVNDLAPASADGTPGKPLRTNGMIARIDPRAEWRQMYRESWRIEREFFYDPHFHGLDLAKISAKYEPYVNGLSCRSDLTYLQEEMLGEMTVGHMFISGPREFGDAPPATGLLGANYTVDRDRYRFAHIVAGGNWNPALYSPLTQPGVNVREGEYLLAVNGMQLHASENLYSAFDGMANRQTTITVGPNPDGTGSRDVIVVPVASERPMREQEWINDNIRKVDEMSHGEVAYVYLPNTAGAGFSNFNRYFFAQTNKKGVVIDERWNQGGLIADYVIDVLKRQPMLNYVGREGIAVTEPSGAIYGPKVMIINQNAGSGGDAMPWLFRKAQVGTLVGTKTWGGLVGIGGYPTLLDGGSITAPRTALYGLTGQWEVENHGIAPDVEVQQDPKAVADGHDPQLEKSVEIVLQQLKEHPLPTYPRPDYPNYHKEDGLGAK